MPTLDTKLKIALMGVATKLLTAQATKFQSMLLKLKDDYLVKLQEDGINQINEKGPTIVCPIIIPEIERILPKLNTLKEIVTNMYKLSGTIDDITTKINTPIQVVNTTIPLVELSVTAIPVPTPPGVLLGINKALDILKKLLDGLETGVNSLSSTSGIIVEYVRTLDNLLQTVEDTLLDIVNLCASNFNDEQEAELVNNIRNALFRNPENANTTLEEDIEEEIELEEQLTNGDLTYQGFRLTIEYDPTPTTLLPSKRIKAVGLADTEVEILVEGGEANIPIEGVKLYYPTPLPLSEEEIQELQSEGDFYDSSYTYSSNNKTLLTLIKNKIDNYLNGKTEDYVRYKITFNYEEPNFRDQIQSQIDWLQDWQDQHSELDLSELIEEGEDLLEEIPDTYYSLSYNGTPLENGSVLNLPPGNVELEVEENTAFKTHYEDFLNAKKINILDPSIISGNSILSSLIKNSTSLDQEILRKPYYILNVINASTIEVIVETTGTKRGADYYNFDNFPNEGAKPFEEIPENIDITKAPQIKEYDGDEGTKGFYAWDDFEKRWDILDLKPFGYIEGVKDGDWKVKRENGQNTYYEWEAGAYTANGQLNPNNYPKWVKKTIAQWKARTGNLWKLCSNFMRLYNVPRPSTGADETCVIYYRSNESNTNDKFNPVDTLRGAIWKWDEESVRWLPQNLGTALNYIEPTDNKYWDPNNWDNSAKKLSISINSDDIPSGGKWNTILQSDVDIALDSYFLNTEKVDKSIVTLNYSPPKSPVSKIRSAVEEKYGNESPEHEASKNDYDYTKKPSKQLKYKNLLIEIPSLKPRRSNTFNLTLGPRFYYNNLNNNNFDEAQKELAKKLFEGRR